MLWWRQLRRNVRKQKKISKPRSVSVGETSAHPHPPTDWNIVVRPSLNHQLLPPVGVSGLAERSTDKRQPASGLLWDRIHQLSHTLCRNHIMYGVPVTDSTGRGEPIKRYYGCSWSVHKDEQDAALPERQERSLTPSHPPPKHSPCHQGKKGKEQGRRKKKWTQEKSGKPSFRQFCTCRVSRF